jgi:hypothetical protein
MDTTIRLAIDKELRTPGQMERKIISGKKKKIS